MKLIKGKRYKLIPLDDAIYIDTNQHGPNIRPNMAKIFEEIGYITYSHDNSTNTYIQIFEDNGYYVWMREWLREIVYLPDELFEL